MSLAGGTGSGLGTYLTYALKDNFEDAIIANHVVWPYTSGEVVLQNYNSLLTLSHLYQCSDMIMAQQNSQLQEICTKLLAIKNVTMEDMNKVIAEKLASILQPSFKEGLSPVDTLYQLTSSLACHPGFKMVSIKSIPHVSERSMEFTMYLWSGLLKHLRQMLIADSAMEEGKVRYCLANFIQKKIVRWYLSSCQYFSLVCFVKSPTLFVLFAISC